MACCEKCKSPQNYAPFQMAVDPVAQIFVGPCCAGETVGAAPVQPLTRTPPNVRVLSQVHPSGEPEYGFEVSNRVGVRAFINYGGINIAFEKNPRELKDWAQKNGLMAS